MIPQMFSVNTFYIIIYLNNIHSVSMFWSVSIFLIIFCYQPSTTKIQEKPNIISDDKESVSLDGSNGDVNIDFGVCLRQ